MPESEEARWPVVQAGQRNVSMSCYIARRPSLACSEGIMQGVRSLIVVLALSAELSAQTQTPPPIRFKETVVVSAKDAKVVADAINELRKSRDPLVAEVVADNLVKLVEAMAASGRVNEIGPLSPEEADLIDLREFMEKYSFPGGPIFVRPRNADSTPGPRLFTFTPSAFIAMCADMASSPFVQLRVVQETKMIVVARMIADISEQRDKVIAERLITKGALAGFKNQDLKGEIIGRVEGIADAMAVNADGNEPYTLVTPSEAAAFKQIGHMERGVFEVVEKPRIDAVNVSYEGKTYSTSVNHFVWFFLRFLLADEGATEAGALARRRQLGSRLLDNLSVQLQQRVVESVLTSLEKPGPAGPDGLVLGDFAARGPGLDALKKAPGLLQQESGRGPDYRTLVVSAKQMAKLDELREWLKRAASKSRD